MSAEKARRTEENCKYSKQSRMAKISANSIVAPTGTSRRNATPTGPQTTKKSAGATFTFPNSTLKECKNHERRAEGERIWRSLDGALKLRANVPKFLPTCN